MKPEGCRGCGFVPKGSAEPSLIVGDFTRAVKGRVAVLFVGPHSSGAGEKVFEGPVGRFLHDSAERLNNAYGGTYIYKCSLSYQWNQVHPDSRPGKRCIELFIGEFAGCSPKVVVTLGSPASLVLTSRNVNEMPDHVSRVRWNGLDMNLVALPSPSGLVTYGNVFLEEVWNRRWKVVEEFLEEG